MSMMLAPQFFGSRVPTVYTVATGGSITTDGNYKVHSFTSSGTFEVTTLGDDDTVEYLVIAGGAAGGSETGGGGGAGGYSGNGGRGGSSSIACP